MRITPKCILALLSLVLFCIALAPMVEGAPRGGRGGGGRGGGGRSSGRGRSSSVSYSSFGGSSVTSGRHGPAAPARQGHTSGANAAIVPKRTGPGSTAARSSSGSSRSDSSSKPATEEDQQPQKAFGLDE